MKSFIGMDNFWTFETTLEADEFAVFEEKVGDLVESLVWDAGIVKGIARPDHRDELDARIGKHTSWSPMDETDWLEEDEKTLPPLTIGKLFICTPHYHGEIPGDKTLLRLRSSHAFGSGHHPTTAGCLEAIQKIDKVKRALDIGCGSGILTLAIEALFHADVIGTDIDLNSVRIAQENAGGKVEIVHCETPAHKKILAKAPFDLIISNIHSGPLCAMAPIIAQLLDPEGVLILAGLLKEQKDEVVEAYRKQGIQLKALQGKDPNWPILKLSA